jgi:hypothetical protein
MRGIATTLVGNAKSGLSQDGEAETQLGLGFDPTYEAVA